MRIQEKGVVVSNTEAARNLHFIEVLLPQIAQLIKPGNFVSFLSPAQSGAFLRRPFSTAGSNGKSLKFIIKNIGRATGAITSLKKNDQIDVLGPLGTGYPEFESDKKILYLGGGTGIASLLFLSDRHNNSDDMIIWGGKTKCELPDKNTIPQKCILATDDGSCGMKGNVVEVAKSYIASGRPDIIVACGPRGLLKGVQTLCAECGIPAWISTEEFMACGMGACAGCAVRLAKGGYAKACSDGPVFRADEVIL